MRRNNVASTSFRRRVPISFLINQCQIITFLILKYDIIENSRIELRGIVLSVQMDGLLGGPKGMLPPPSQIIGGGGAGPSLALPPLPTPMIKKSFSQSTVKIFISAFFLQQLNIAFLYLGDALCPWVIIHNRPDTIINKYVGLLCMRICSAEDISSAFM